MSARYLGALPLDSWHGQDVSLVMTSVLWCAWIFAWSVVGQAFAWVMRMTARVAASRTRGT
jgi:CHASE2 domain-containing sensor protein